MVFLNIYFQIDLFIRFILEIVLIFFGGIFELSLPRNVQKRRQVGGWVWDLANARGGSIDFVLPAPRGFLLPSGGGGATSEGLGRGAGWQWQSAGGSATRVARLLAKAKDVRLPLPPTKEVQGSAMLLAPHAVGLA
jgi:hypothetical protein